MSIAMGERRDEATVIGPGSPGHLRVLLGQRARDVPSERVPPSLRTPNSRFVAVVQGGDFLRVETAGRAWLVIQDRVRAVLNANWDPIGVAEDVADEYDSFIGVIYWMLRRGTSPEELAAQLLKIETESMGLDGLPEVRRLEVARRLLALELPTP
jgi:hypothetical protein